MHRIWNMAKSALSPYFRYPRDGSVSLGKFMCFFQYKPRPVSLIAPVVNTIVTDKGALVESAQNTFVSESDCSRLTPPYVHLSW